MICKDDEYFDYLKNRSSFKMFLRKFLLKGVSGNFRGKVLDVGCGIGEFLEVYPNSEGCEINEKTIEYCKSKGLKVFCCDIQKSVPKGSYDGVFCSNVLEHLQNYMKALENIDKLVKEGCVFILILPNKQGFEHDRTHNPDFDYGKAIGWLKEHGYKIKKSRLLKLPVPVWFNDIVFVCKKTGQPK